MHKDIHMSYQIGDLIRPRTPLLLNPYREKAFVDTKITGGGSYVVRKNDILLFLGIETIEYVWTNDMPEKSDLNEEKITLNGITYYKAPYKYYGGVSGIRLLHGGLEYTYVLVFANRVLNEKYLDTLFQKA